MYPVSAAYLTSMASMLREMPGFFVRCCTADLQVNSKLSVTFDRSPLQAGDNLTSLRTMPFYKKRATLERDHMKADGTYSTSDTGCYIGAFLSDAQPEESGRYAYSQRETIYVAWPSSNRPLSIVFDSCVAQVQVLKTNGAVETQTFFDDGINHVLSLYDFGTGSISVQVTHSFKALRRIRVYGIYAANVTDWSSGDIVSIDFHDENDLICLELPERKVTVEINNSNMKYDPVHDAETAYFSKNETQAYLVFVYNGESVPVGRLILNDYYINANYIQLVFGGPFALLQNSQHLVSPTNQTVLERLNEIFNPSASGIMDAFKNEVTASFEKHGVTADTTAAEDMDMIIQNPFPVLPEIECLQLLCNLSGLIPRPGRANTDVVIDRCQTRGVRSVSYSELTHAPEYFRKENAGGIKIGRHDLGEKSKETISDGVAVSTKHKVFVKLERPVDNSADLVKLVYDNMGNEIGGVYVYAQGYTAAVCIELEDPTQTYSENSGPISLLTYAVQKDSVFHDGNSARFINNPLVDSSLAEGYQQRIYQNLSGQLYVKLRHRGFPELDCGDLIRVELKPDSAYTEGRVIENEWKFRAGVLTGETTIQINAGVG